MLYILIDTWEIPVHVPLFQACLGEAVTLSEVKKVITEWTDAYEGRRSVQFLVFNNFGTLFMHFAHENFEFVLKRTVLSLS